MKCKIVVGANYGDEGKGLITHTLTSEAIKNGKVLNSLYNGGCQRGHTVEYKNGIKHVFKHFGSGTLDGADTYFNKDFMLNPTQFIKEYEELTAIYKNSFNQKILTKCFCHRDCRVSTPYDALLNQMLELNRNEGRHGSCGWGIFETRKRYESSKYNWTFLEMRCANNKQLYSYLEEIAKKYLPEKLEEYMVKDSIIDQFRNICIDSNLIYAYINDFRTMCKLIDIIYLGDLLKKYETVIYEGGQGLALSETNVGDFPYLTPSKTGSELPIKEIESYTNDIEVIYVSRTYFTRHGAGPLIFECNKDMINPDIEDLTNFPNEFQKSLRFAPLDYNVMLDRIIADNYKNYKRSIYLTHCNYVQLSDEILKTISAYFDQVRLISDKYGLTNNLYHCGNRRLN